MNFQFPETRFVRENSLADQLEHVAGEAVEAVTAHTKGEPLVEVAIELLDAIHSAETGLRIVVELGLEIDLSDLKNHVIAKNRARGYYE